MERRDRRRYVCDHTVGCRRALYIRSFACTVRLPPDAALPYALPIVAIDACLYSRHPSSRLIDRRQSTRVNVDAALYGDASYRSRDASGVAYVSNDHDASVVIRPTPADGKDGASVTLADCMAVVSAA